MVGFLEFKRALKISYLFLTRLGSLNKEGCGVGMYLSFSLHLSVLALS